MSRSRTFEIIGFGLAISACLLEAVQLQIRGCQSVLGIKIELIRTAQSI